MADDSITITVSEKRDVEWIRNKVRDGFFSSEEEAIRTGLSRLREEDEQVETWLRDVVVPRYDWLKANPDAGIPIEEVERHLQQRREERLEQRTAAVR